MITLGRLGRLGSIRCDSATIAATGAAFASNAFDAGAFNV